MVPTTSLPVDEYEIVNTGTRAYSIDNLQEIVQKTLTEVSAGYEHEGLLANENLILSTYGKYANKHIKMTEALLEEHRAEREHEDKKLTK